MALILAAGTALILPHTYEDGTGIINPANYFVAQVYRTPVSKPFSLESINPCWLPHRGPLPQFTPDA